jgi:lactate permease
MSDSFLPLTPAWISLALLPLVSVLYLMIGRNWGGSKAGPAGWLTAVFLSLLFFGSNGQLLLVALGKSVLLSLYVLYIIWMALLLYHVVNEAGVIAAIGRELPRLAQDRPAQALLLAWIFGGFLQGATGFGVPAAIVAPLLLGLGFAANVAVVLALLGHAWAVTFGSLGSSFLALMAATGLPGEMLAGPSAAMLGICCLGCGLAVLWLVGGETAVRQRGLFMLSLALIMGAVQWGLAVAGLWTLAALGSTLAGLLLAIAYFSRSQPDVPTRWRLLGQAFLPYVLLMIIIMSGQLVLGDWLSFLVINPVFPAVETSLGWQMAAGTGRSLDLFGHPGALLLYASLLTFAWYRWRGTIRNIVDSGQLTVDSGQLTVGGDTHYAIRNTQYNGRLILQKTVKGSIKPTIAILSLVAMAVTMEHVGMTYLLALAISQTTGDLFPLLSPFIGALGAFMTGSNTNSNVVFGQLQQQTALALNLAVPIILAGQTAGGALGGLFAPAKVIIGCSTVEGADEGHVLKLATAYGLGLTLVVGLTVLIVVRIA